MFERMETAAWVFGREGKCDEGNDDFEGGMREGERPRTQRVLGLWAGLSRGGPGGAWEAGGHVCVSETAAQEPVKVILVPRSVEMAEKHRRKWEHGIDLRCGKPG